MTNDYDKGFEDGLKQGFAAVPNHLFGHLTAHEIAVYAALARRAGAKGSCYPSHRKIAEDAGCSERQVIRALHRLVEMGIVDKRHQRTDTGRQQVNLYYLRTDRRLGPEGGDSQAGVTDRHPRGDSQAPPGVTEGQTKKNHRNNNHVKNPPASQSPQRGDDDPAGEIEWLRSALVSIEADMQAAQSHEEWHPLAIQHENLREELASATMLADINAEPPVEVPSIETEEVAA